MKYRPINQQVVLEYIDEKPTSAIIVPEAHQKKSVTLRIKAVAPAAYEKFPELKPGLKVSLLPYGGSVVKHDGKEYRVVHGDDILGVFE